MRKEAEKGEGRMERGRDVILLRQRSGDLDW